MENQQTNHPITPNRAATRTPSRIFDILLEHHKTLLRQCGFLEKIADQMDHYTQFRRVHADDLAKEHRWTKHDIGKSFVGFEVPDGQGRGIVFEVIVVAVFGSTAISFEVRETFELTFDRKGDHSVWHFGPFPEDTKFEIDGENPFTWETVDRTCAMLDYEETYDRYRVYMAIQDWALQPKQNRL